MAAFQMSGLGWKDLSLILVWFSVQGELLFQRSIKLNMKTILSAFARETLGYSIVWGGGFLLLFYSKKPIFLL